MKKLYITIILLAFITTVFAGTKKADRLFENWEYYKAAELYKKESEKRPSAEVYFKLGESYRMMNNYKALEQAAYDKVNSYGTYSDPKFYLNYGQVLKANGKNAEAKIAFEKYAQLVPGDKRGKFFAESIDIIRKDHESDEKIIIKNVKSINSEQADYSAVNYRDGIVFASSRKTSGHSKIYNWTGGNYLDLYFAEKTKDKMAFNDVRVFGGEKNSKTYHDGPVSFTKNYDTLYISRVDKSLKGKYKKMYGIERNQIFVSVMDNGEWTKPTAFPYNSDTFSVTNPFITKEGNRIYFVSDMAFGYGETDIYYCDKNGDNWSQPVNMGPNVNTFNREKFPYVDSLGNFYFSSDGYQGLGGMDICISMLKEGVLQSAIPMKYPINTSNDDYAILFTEYNRSGYISSNRPEASIGDADIFYFNFDTDNLSEKIHASDYTIGYKKITKKEKVAELVPTPTPTPVAVVEAKPVSPAPVFKRDVLNMHFVYFDFDKSNLSKKSTSYLDSVVSYMNDNPKLNLLMTGHCDERGTDAYNMRLSEKRVNSTSSYLVKKGIAKKRITTEAYGLKIMVNKCEGGVECTEEEHQMNRRVEFYFE